VANYYPSMTTVYALFSEPSLALPRSHVVGAFHVLLPYPTVSYTLGPGLGARETATSRLSYASGACHRNGFTFYCAGTRIGYPSRAAVLTLGFHGLRRPSWGNVAASEGKKRGPE
jgi:hypothetical protein